MSSGGSVKYRVLKPVEIAYISYPYEWSFSQLKDAALLTLRVQELALEFDLTLKDASAFNVQFHKGRPIFIEGRLRLDSWEDKQTGQKRNKLGVVLENFQFMGSGQGRSDETAEAPKARVAAAPQSADAPPPQEDDVPF